jgi:3-oxoacyl-[acyl-carrier protein] reductase
MELGLVGRRVAVTGGGAGIGRSVVLSLLHEGAHVIAAARSSDDLRELAAQGAYLRGQLFTVCGDMASTWGLSSLIDECKSRVGGLDSLVCTVGNAPRGGFGLLDEDAWAQALDSKLLATVRAVRTALPSLEAASSARVVILAGNSCHDPSPALTASAVVNAALGALTACLAREFARSGVGFVCVDPGPTETVRFADGLAEIASRTGISVEEAKARMVGGLPTGRLSRPEEVAVGVCVLLSPRLSQLTGTRVVIDGAQTWMQ